MEKNHMLEPTVCQAKGRLLKGETNCSRFSNNGVFFLAIG